MKAGPPRRNQAWLAVCCTAALVAIVLSLFVTKPDRATAAAPPTGNNSSIPTAPGAKPTPDPNDDPCRLASCAPTVTDTPDPNKSYALPGQEGDQSSQTEDKDQTKQSSTSGEDSSRDDEDPPDYVGALIDQSRCAERPHVTVPKTGGKAAGKCIPVDSFQAIVVSGDDDASNSVCAVSQVLCTKDSGGSSGDDGIARAIGTQFNFIWGTYRLTVTIAAWFTTWAVTFELFAKIGEFADALREVWDEQVINRIGLGGVGGFVLAVAALWAGLLMLFHRFRRGFAELTVAILIAVIASAFLLHPGDTINRTMNGARYLGLTVAAISSDPGDSRSAPASPDEADRVAGAQVNNAVADKLVTSVLVKPHMIANTGKVQTGVCEKRYWNMLASTGKARDQALARFVEQKADNGQPCAQASALRPSVERVLVGALLLVMAVIVCAFCLLTAGLLLLSQVAAAGYLAVAGIVGTLAPLPGWGRSLLGKWITGLLVAVAGVIASVLIVVVYLNVLGLILGLGQSPLANFAIAIIVALAGFKLRKRLTAGFRNRARQIGAKLEGTLHRPGGETLVERQQRRHTSVSHLQTATAVAGGAAGGAGAGAAAAGNAPGSGDEALPTNGSKEPKKGAGFGARVRNAMGQTPHGRLAMETASGGSGKPAPLPSGRSAVIAGGVAGVAAAGVARGNQAAQRTARSVKNEVIDATTPSGSIVSSARATRMASRVSGSSGVDSSARAKEVIAEMRRRQQQREQELRRGSS